jgi:hypothetical protein
MAGRQPVVLLDGLPGSGKTTTSQKLAAVYAQRGEPCVWLLEEAKDHPLFGADIRRQHRRADYDTICLAQWARLLDELDDPERLTLDGCALQSTVRFMFEQSWPMNRIASYWHQFQQCLAPIPVSFVYLRHPDAASFILRHTMHVRTDVWPKIAQHVEQTPAGRMLASEGFDASVEFWVRYRQVCDDLLAQTNLPLLELDIGGGWDHVVPGIVRWLDEIEDEPTESLTRDPAP